MTNNSTAISFQFTEEMKGYMSADETAFEDGFQRGREQNHYFMFHLTIRSEDLDQFLQSPEHQAEAIGYVEGDLVGGRCTVEKGVFNLFVDSADLNRKQMRYRLFFNDSAGQPMTFSGVKEIQDNVGPDLWRDTTTLFTNLFRGHVAAEQEAKAELYAVGILHIETMDFMKQLTTIRSGGGNLAERMQGIERFGKFFMGGLWDIYGPSLMPRMGAFEREIPLYTTEGVKDAEITTHPFNTTDKLGLSLLRYQRAASDDVVVILHGLTTSSDMFIMPEHNNLVQYLLDHGFEDVWTLDYRMSNRFSYNLHRNNFNMDDIALYDHPAAIAKVREAVGPNRRIHVICHCLGSVSFTMALFGKTVTGIRSVIANSVALTPRIPKWSKVKLSLGPFLSDYVFSLEYLNPYWRREPGWSIGKAIGWGVSLFHRECDVPECHMLSFMWGTGFPALYSHENLLDVTHRRGGDLYGGVSVNYYRHVNKMVNNDNTAVKYNTEDPRYRPLPDNYFQYAEEIETPVLFVTGEKNKVFTDSNIVCHRRLEEIVPGRHQLHVFPGYGHQDVFMGKNVDKDIFPRFLQFLEQNRD
ncbi:alpha/beta fold hydrolase [Methylomarinum sp. Ch1-1]|uniref:Alpha/beta fold hydrolase n=1 Tax=Methylomarinum roseum TaxID=3067653 RepID=A0AAU7NZC8_9GAMM|nr:alpha/beta fold hydrolase [Methylomarinum sp. Ch1-1]MDP4521517.1 alpha/beta fold hydrolase [Methylomarinum sp. Ch1-1]